MFARYADRAARHTMQVDFVPYLNRLERLVRHGRDLRDEGAGVPGPVARAVRPPPEAPPAERRRAS